MGKTERLIKEMPVSEARRRLPSLLKRLRRHPEERVRITVHGLVAGELRASEPDRADINAGAALLKTLTELGERTKDYPRGRRVAEEHDDFLYRR